MRKQKLAFLLVLFTLIFTPVSATTLSVDPSSIIDSGLTSGETFDISIKVDDVTDLAHWQIAMSFNPDVLSCSDATKGAFPAGCAWLSPTIDNTNGEILAGCYLLEGSSESGSGTLTTITFEVVGTGESNLDLDGTELLDSNTNDIDFQGNDGYFSNSPAVTSSTTVSSSGGGSGGGGGGGGVTTTTTTPVTTVSEITTTTTPVTTVSEITTTMPIHTPSITARENYLDIVIILVIVGAILAVFGILKMNASRK